MDQVLRSGDHEPAYWYSNIYSIASLGYLTPLDRLVNEDHDVTPNEECCLDYSLLSDPSTFWRLGLFWTLLLGANGRIWRNLCHLASHAGDVIFWDLDIWTRVLSE